MMKKPAKKLPDWDDNTDAGNRKMLAWLEAELDRLLDEEWKQSPDSFSFLYPPGDEAAWEKWFVQWMERRWRYGPLLKEPTAPPVVKDWLRKFIRGQTRPVQVGAGRPAGSKATRRAESLSPSVLGAARDVPRIRQLWEDYYGRRQRTKAQTDAAGFAAMRWFEDGLGFADWQALGEAVRSLLKRPAGKRLDLD